MLTRTRSRSQSIDTTCSGEESGLSQGLERQSSTASSCTLVDSQTSSYVDSQDSAPPTRSSSSTKSRGGAKPRPPMSKATQWVMIVPETSLESDTPNNAHPQFIGYPDPHTGCVRQYLISADSKTVYEVNKNTDEYRSWFIGNTVQSDGTLYVCTQIDPLFFALPVLISSQSDKYTDLDTILSPSPHSQLLEQLLSIEQLSHITECKVTKDGDTFYRYSQDKTIKWLTLKVERLADTLKAQDIYVGGGSRSGHYVPSTKNSTLSQEDYLCYASGMIGDYIPPELTKLLATKYGQALNNIAKHGLTEGEEEDSQPPKKKVALSNCDPTEDYSKGYKQPIPVKTVTKLTKAQKALSQVNKKGMPKLSSFFKK